MLFFVFVFFSSVASGRCFSKKERHLFSPEFTVIIYRNVSPIGDYLAILEEEIPLLPS